MLSRVLYFLRETFVSLFRNISMTVAAVLTIFVTLSLVGASILVFLWNDQGKSTVEKSVRFEIFMLPNAQQEQINNVRETLNADKKDGKIAKVSYLSKEKAYELFKVYFKDDKELVKSITKDALPVSFLVAPSKPDEKYFQSLIDKYSAIPGVEKITTANFKDEIRRANTINQTLAVFAIVLLIASCVLVFNTVRLAVYARRREIEIMKLVGASNWFVQVPFIAEGALQGFAGGFLASISTYVFGYAVLDNQFTKTQGFNGFYITSTEVWMTVILTILFGITIGFGSSYVGLKRYLDV